MVATSGLGSWKPLMTFRVSGLRISEPWSGNCDTKNEQNEQTEHKIPKQHRDIQIIQGSGLPWSHQKDSKSPKYPKYIDF